MSDRLMSGIVKIKWFVSARKHNQVVTAYELAKKLADERQARIYLLEEKVAWLQKALTATHTSTSGVDAKSARDVNPYGRSGWRTRAQVASEATVPQPKDSIQALEQRVAKEGGKTDAV